MWPFKKTVQHRRIVLEVPSKHVPKLLKMWDKYINRKESVATYSKYLFWTEIAEIFPQTRNGAWHWDTTHADRPLVIELKIGDTCYCESVEDAAARYIEENPVALR